MGKRGPKPQSAETKALKGNPGNRPLAKVQEGVDPTSGHLRMPQSLTKDQREVWQRLISAYPSWYFTPADRDLLASYCQVQARIASAEHLMKNKPMVLERGNGSACRNPLLDIIDKQRGMLLQLTESLGLGREKRKQVVPGASGPSPEVPSDPDGDDPDNFGNLIPDL